MNAATYRTKLTRSIQARVARKLDLSRSHVCMVANGLRKSNRVERALSAEYDLVEQEVARYRRLARRAA